MNNQVKQLKNLLTELNSRLEHGVDNPHLDYTHKRLNEIIHVPIIQDHHISDLVSRIVHTIGPEIANARNSALREQDLPEIYDSGDIRPDLICIIADWMPTIEDS